jgi:phosphoribosylaminoimidazole-succinocarboxamide synthase
MHMNAINIARYRKEIEAALSHCIHKTALPINERTEGKVRDFYDLGEQIILVTTDRLSAFDRQLALIPFKGQALNLTSAWWFQKTAHIVPNHLIAVPDPNVIVAKKCSVFPIEFVVRGYITGTTSTSLWTQYNAGVREYCGIRFPEGLKKNQKLEQAVLTPTTKEKTHDRPILVKEIIEEKWMSEEDWQQASSLALALYKTGVTLAKKHGLILVDTKYEFGRDSEGNILVVDEIHTPDSSRYWLAENYEERLEAGLEPENFDKEFLRMWFANHCDPYQDKVLPQAPEELIIQLSSRYIQLYETITGNSLKLNHTGEDAQQRILNNIASYLR